VISDVSNVLQTFEERLGLKNFEELPLQSHKEVNTIFIRRSLLFHDSLSDSVITCQANGLSLTIRTARHGL
jgi:hypothetical protein